MGNRRGPAVHTIPPIRAFADALVAGLLAQFGTDRMVLARGMILVPNNRAGQAVRDAFVRQAEHGLLLPRLVVLGDSELDENTGVALDTLDAEPLPPAVEPLLRQLILARLIQRDDNVDAAGAMRLAADLGRTLDQLIVEEVAPSKLRDVDLSGELSSHWNVSLKRLNTILEDWPEELRQIDRIDLADRRNRQLDRVSQRWRSAPPEGYVVAAGISTGVPAVARLLETIAHMPRGQVVLDGLDLDIGDDEWSAVGGSETSSAIETHPQFHLHQLLGRMRVARRDVRRWRWSGDIESTARRARAISHAFAPADATRNWVDLEKAERNLAGVTALELANPAEEAQAIALAIRHTIEAPGRTVALMTPDRDLAKRVSAHLERWGIRADDSAGQPLSATPNGTLLLALVTVAVEQFAPSALLTLLKHPLVSAGQTRRDWLDGARRLDLALRGPRPPSGTGGITTFLQGGDDRTRPLRLAVQDWWTAVASLLEPLEGLASQSLASMIATLREVATSLAGDPLWSGQAGQELAKLVTELEKGAEQGPQSISLSSLPQMLRQLMDGIAVRPGYGGHPRVFIWGLLEAKLQSADFMILGGLNEGVWPQLPAPDPWLAPRIRRELKLPSLERRIGLSAHDLASALGAPNVMLTRANRDASSPTIASRFWLRLETMTGGIDLPAVRYDVLARRIDASMAPPKRASRPAPCPPIADRPTNISVTDVDRLSADPFAFYAKTMLGLKPLDAVDADPNAAWRGSLIHGVLEDWAKVDHYAPGRLVERMDAALSDGTIHPLTRALWLPRLREAAVWIAAEVAQNIAFGRMPLVAEKSGHTQFAGVKLRGRADRIDRLVDGGLAIVDYKTGEGPKNKQVDAGYAMQLGLIGLIAEQGGFDGVSGEGMAFEYWSLARDPASRTFGKITSPATGKNPVAKPDAFVAKIADQFAKAAAKWLTGGDPFTAKLSPDYARHDYDHLMRLEEWQGRDG